MINTLLPNEVITLYVCSLTSDWYKALGDTLPTHHPWLSAEELQRVGRFRFEKDRQLSLVSKLLMRWGLSQLSGKPPADFVFSSGKHGKPFLPEHPELQFNLSHTENVVVLAATSSPLVKRLGVDVEKLHPNRGSYKLAQRFFSEQETQQLLDQTPWEPKGLERFNRYWTLKESFIKAMGTGLSMPLKKFGFDLDTPGTIRFYADNDIPLGDDPWHFRLLSFREDFRIALGFQSTAAINFHTSLASTIPSSPDLISFESVQVTLTNLASTL